MTLSEPDPSCGDGDERLVSSVQLVEARCDSAKVLEAAREAFDEIAPLVDVAIKGAWFDSVCAWGNHRLGTGCYDGVDQRLGVVGFVGSNRIGADAREQWLRFAHVGRLSGCQAPTPEVAEGFDQGMDLRGQAAARATDGLRTFFFWAPAAC